MESHRSLSRRICEMVTGDPDESERERELKAAANRFVAEEVLGGRTALSQAVFAAYLFSSLSPSLTKVGFRLALKGGVLMRICLLAAVQEGPSDVGRSLLEKYGPFLGPSDVDFVAEKEGKPPLRDEVRLAASAAEERLSEMRREVLGSSPFLALSPEARRNKLTRLSRSTGCEGVSALGEEGGKGADLLPAEGDFVVRKRRKGREVCKEEGRRWVYVSKNETLRFAQGKGIAHFDLVRMKVGFLFVEREEREEKGKTGTNEKNGKIRRVGGEVCDVSIPHRDDYKTRLPPPIDLNSKRLPRFSTYLIGNRHLVGLSVPSVCDDLCFVLFKGQTHPWQDSKYEKRVERLMCFLLVYALLDSRLCCGERCRSAPEYARLFRSFCLPGGDASSSPQGSVWRSVYEGVSQYVEKPLPPSYSEEATKMLNRIRSLSQFNASLLDREPLSKSFSTSDSSNSSKSPDSSNSPVSTNSSDTCSGWTSDVRIVGEV